MHLFCCRSRCAFSACQLRVSAIRLMHIVMVTKPEAFMETDGLKDARTRCISLFFKSLTSRADQVIRCSRQQKIDNKIALYGSMSYVQQEIGLVVWLNIRVFGRA